MLKNLFNNIYEKFVTSKLTSLRSDNLVFINSGEKIIVGSHKSLQEVPTDLPTLKINNKEAFKKLFFKGGVGLAESYAKGLIEITDLYKTLCFFCNNISNVSRFEKINFFYSLVSKIKFLTIQKLCQKIKEEYLITMILAMTFLSYFDETMMYSSALLVKTRPIFTMAH